MPAVIAFMTDSETEQAVPVFVQAKEVTTAAVQRLSEFNRRTLDTLASRIYFYYSWSYECCNALADIRRSSSPPCCQAFASTSSVCCCCMPACGAFHVAVCSVCHAVSSCTVLC